jgi:3-oxoacyl-[acyl-carrier-protein] synthase-3
MNAIISQVEYHLPENILSNEELAARFPEWPAHRIEEKLGIVERRIAANNETSSDLAEAAAEKLFHATHIQRNEVDYLIFCTQTPDYLLPSSSCVLQNRLKIPKSCGAIDFNLGCSGYVYGLGLAKGLIETRQANKVLLLTGETYSKLLLPDDKSTRTLFGDAGTATLIESSNKSENYIGPFAYGTDGSGSDHLIVHKGGLRQPGLPMDMIDGLKMEGTKIFNFSIKEVKNCLQQLLKTSGKSLDDIDLFVFHQANGYMLDFLCRKCGINPSKFYKHYKNVGNTVSNSIPIALHHAMKEGRIGYGSLVALVGFGVGLSWGSCLVKFPQIDD